jgi:rod shape-determining protein MreC
MRYFYLSIVIFVLGYAGILFPIKAAAQWVFTPFQFGLRQSAVSIKETAGFFVHLTEIRSENLALREENITLRSTVVGLKKAEEENKDLKEQLKVPVTLNRNLLLVNLMGNPQDLTGSSFIVDRGSSQGIKKGDSVIKSGYLVGVIHTVEAQRSFGDFITSPKVAIAVKDIDTEYQTEGLAEGQHGSSILVKRILPNEIISEGDTMVTTGKDGKFIPDLIVGRVTQVIEVPSEPLKSAYLETMLDLSRLSQVFVIIN